MRLKLRAFNNHVLQLKHDKLPDGGPPASETAKTPTRGGRRRIRCPKCAWEPRKTDRWACMPACGCVWNTFDTGGRCPSCGIQWKDTACLRCHEFSPHKDWYEAPPSDSSQ